jgi:hypothetical protein
MLQAREAGGRKGRGISSTMYDPPMPMPENEMGRLRALRILDTPREEFFDDLAFVAAHVCDTPIALVTFVDGSRQWFTARVNLETTETSRDVAFCSYAILSDDIFEVPDSHADERFADNPLVTGYPERPLLCRRPSPDARRFRRRHRLRHRSPPPRSAQNPQPPHHCRTGTAAGGSSMRAGKGGDVFVTTSTDADHDSYAKATVLRRCRRLPRLHSRGSSASGRAARV